MLSPNSAKAEPPAGAFDELALLEQLVATPSVSGDEEAVARLLEATAQRLGLAVIRDDTALRIELTSARPGPTLALISHLDVVPVGEGWTRPPFTPQLEQASDGERLYGRGACDAKASVAAMVGAAWDLASRGGPARGRLLLLFGYSEETKETTMPRARLRCGTIDAAIIGEPTSLDLAVAQRGLMIVELQAHGPQHHAAYPNPDGSGHSAVLTLAADLVALPTLMRERPHPLLGQPSLTPTMLEAGVARNIAPPLAKALLDIRTTPAWPHSEVATALRQHLGSNVVVQSQRLEPCETAQSSRLLALAQTLRPSARRYGSATCSDWVFLRDVDAVKCGPGDSKRSHTADEFVLTDEVRTARRFYAQLAQEYLS